MLHFLIRDVYTFALASTNKPLNYRVWSVWKASKCLINAIRKFKLRLPKAFARCKKEGEWANQSNTNQKHYKTLSESRVNAASDLLKNHQTKIMYQSFICLLSEEIEAHIGFSWFILNGNSALEVWEEMMVEQKVSDSTYVNHCEIIIAQSTINFCP